LKKVLKSYYFKVQSVKADIAVEELSLGEPNALRYTAGDVPQCLIFKKSKIMQILIRLC